MYYLSGASVRLGVAFCTHTIHDLSVVSVRLGVFGVHRMAWAGWV